MISIRRIYSTATPGDRDAIVQVQQLFRKVFTEIPERADLIADQLDNPFKYGYVTIALVAYGKGRSISGFALVNHFPEINSSFLDFLATDPNIRSGGIGGAVYEAVREHLQHIGSLALYVEVLPDDAETVRDPVKLVENRRRLSFYARYGAFPVAGTDYESPIDEDPLAGSGVLLEVRIKNANEIITISPGAIYYNNDVLPEQTLYGRVTNESGGAAAIGVTIRAFTQTHTDAIVGGTFGSG